MKIKQQRESGIDYFDGETGVDGDVARIVNGPPTAKQIIEAQPLNPYRYLVFMPLPVIPIAEKLKTEN
jgi:hypothetical protein